MQQFLSGFSASQLSGSSQAGSYSYHKAPFSRKVQLAVTIRNVLAFPLAYKRRADEAYRISPWGRFFVALHSIEPLARMDVTF